MPSTLSLAGAPLIGETCIGFGAAAVQCTEGVQRTTAKMAWEAPTPIAAYKAAGGDSGFARHPPTDAYDEDSNTVTVFARIDITSVSDIDT